MKKRLLKRLGFLKLINKIELEIIEKFENLSLTPHDKAKATEIVMKSLKKI